MAKKRNLIGRVNIDAGWARRGSTKAEITVAFDHYETDCLHAVAVEGGSQRGRGSRGGREVLLLFIATDNTVIAAVKDFVKGSVRTPKVLKGLYRFHES